MGGRFITIVLMTVAFCSAVSAQNCPTISIETPNGLISPQQPATFTAHFSIPQTSANLKYYWGSRLGVITGDFTQPTMTLVTERKHGSANVYVFVRVEGLPPECPNLASEIVGVAQVLEGDPADEFGVLRPNDVKARIDNFYVSIEHNRPYTGLIEMFFSRKETLVQRLARVEMILAAIRFRSYDITKISFAFLEGEGSPTTSLWLVPTGADVREDRPSAIFVTGSDVRRSPKKSLGKLSCPCK